MTDIVFRQARFSDIPALQAFMECHWRKGHVLARRVDMWAYEFTFNAPRELLNIGLAVEDEEIAGLFGWMPYSQSERPDIAGSLWKVRETSQKRNPMLGLKLRQWVIDHVPHRFFAAPGAGPQTEPIYHLLGMQWHRMEQFFALNPAKSHFSLVRVANDFPAALNISEGQTKGSTLQEITSVETLAQLHEKIANPYIWPYKDAAYWQWRYVDYPFADYRIWHGVTEKGEALLAMREACWNGACAWRVVDMIGSEEVLSLVLPALCQRAFEEDAEYIDCIQYGVSRSVFECAGMQSLDFEQSDTIVPNYFEPFEQRNVPVYCVADPVPEGVLYRQFKADGDQDRPNLLEEA